MEEPERIVFRQVLSLNRCFRHGSIVGNNVLAVNQPLGPMCNGRNYRRAVRSKFRVSTRRLDHAGDTTLQRPSAPENNGPPRTIIGGNQGRERKSTRPKELPVAPVSAASSVHSQTP